MYAIYIHYIGHAKGYGVLDAIDACSLVVSYVGICGVRPCLCRSGQIHDCDADLTTAGVRTVPRVRD